MSTRTLQGKDVGPTMSRSIPPTPTNSPRSSPATASRPTFPDIPRPPRIRRPAIHRHPDIRDRDRHVTAPQAAETDQDERHRDRRQHDERQYRELPAGKLREMGEHRQVDQPLAQCELLAEPAEQQARQEHGERADGETGQQPEQSDRERGEGPDGGQLYERGTECAGQLLADVTGAQPVRETHGRPEDSRPQSRGEQSDGEVAARPPQPVDRSGQDRLGGPPLSSARSVSTTWIANPAEITPNAVIIPHRY
jgi:hypothetical protein